MHNWWHMWMDMNLIHNLFKKLKSIYLFLIYKEKWNSWLNFFVDLICKKKTLTAMRNWNINNWNMNILNGELIWMLKGSNNVQWEVNLIWNEEIIFFSQSKNIHIHVVNFNNKYWWKIHSSFLHGLLNVVGHDVSYGIQIK
jgi:hypothetical protein